LIKISCNYHALLALYPELGSISVFVVYCVVFFFFKKKKQGTAWMSGSLDLMEIAHEETCPANNYKYLII
jgi:hypothetical protein